MARRVAMILIQSSPSGDFQQSRLLAPTWLAAPSRHDVSKRPFDGQEERMPIRKEMRQRYPKDWVLRSRFVRFYRARNRCEWCGVHNHTLREDTGRSWFLPPPTCTTSGRRLARCSTWRHSASGVTSATTPRTAPRAGGKGPAARSWRWRSEAPLW